MPRVEMFYDIVCPYAYLASTQIEALAARAGAELVWKPFLLGGVFRAIGAPDRPADTMSAAKQRHNVLDMHRWAEHWDVPLRMPMEHPRRTVLALRALLAVGEPARARATHALYRAYWVDGLDVAKADVVRDALDRAGLDGAAGVAAAETPAIKDALRRLTDEAIARGVFGAPAFFVGDELFWGQDRMQFVERALRATGTSGTESGR